MGADRALSAGYVFGALALVWIGGCSHSTQATAVTVDPKAVTGIRTFVITAPPPRVSRMAPDFQVAYYAGTGQVVDTRAYKTGYYAGHRVDTQTYDYPAGTIIVDVVKPNPTR